jgi:N-formylglutamate deformylase
MPELQDEFDPPFEALEPAECRGPLLFNSPHSGRVYPREFLLTSRLDLATLRRSEDSFVGELIEGVVTRGHPVVRAHFPRCYVDVNREPYELDPRMFEGRLPPFANTRSMRVAGGLGTVARVVGDAQEIYDQRIAVAEAMRRIDGLYKPYHRALRRVFMRLQRDFGAAILIDCHSTPRGSGARRSLWHELRRHCAGSNRAVHARLWIHREPQ